MIYNRLLFIAAYLSSVVKSFKYSNLVVVCFLWNKLLKWVFSNYTSFVRNALSRILVILLLNPASSRSTGHIVRNNGALCSYKIPLVINKANNPYSSSNDPTHILKMSSASFICKFVIKIYIYIYIYKRQL